MNHIVLFPDIRKQCFQFHHLKFFFVCFLWWCFCWYIWTNCFKYDDCFFLWLFLLSSSGIWMTTDDTPVSVGVEIPLTVLKKQNRFGMSFSHHPLMIRSMVSATRKGYHDHYLIVKRGSTPSRSFPAKISKETFSGFLWKFYVVFISSWLHFCFPFSSFLRQYYIK